MEKYLGGEEPNYEALHAPFERAMDEATSCRSSSPTPRTASGSPSCSTRSPDTSPAPRKATPAPSSAAKAPTSSRFEYHNDPARPLLAHVFKVTTDPFVGKLAIFRVHQGKAAGNSQVYIGHSKKSIKLGHVFHLQGKEHREADAIIAGDIGAVAKIEEIHTGDVLHDDHALDSRPPASR